MDEYLLDTHTLIRAITEPEKLPAKIKTILEDKVNDVGKLDNILGDIIKIFARQTRSAGISKDDFPKLSHERALDIYHLCQRKQPDINHSKLTGTAILLTGC